MELKPVSSHPAAADDPNRFDRLIVPAYDPAALTPAVVHFGVGGFHRAHQALFFDDLAASGNSEWGVVGVGIRHRELTDTLTDQGHLFTVIARGSGGESHARVIGAITDTLVLGDSPEAVVDRLADARTRLVTLTVTGNGYAVEDPAGTGRMIFSALVDGLARRRAAGLPPFTVLSCDNLPDSGAAARSATLALAESRDADLARWIAAHVTFPASMVDRITPATTADDVASIEEEFAVRDRSPVITEAFAQWVIEDSFCNARPPLDNVGVRFVEDVAPYKRIKSRVLNGGHCALGYLGYLAGYRRSDEAMADPAIAEFLEALIAEEIAPLLPSDVPGMKLTEYRQAVLKRFANPAISDQLSRLCRRGSTKMADYLLPSLIEATRFGRPRGLLTLVLAAWLRYLRGTDLAGEAIDVNDPRADELVGLANRNGGDPTAVLRLADLFGPLAEDAAMAGEVRDRVRALDRDGVQATVRAVLSASSGGARVA